MTASGFSSDVLKLFHGSIPDQFRKKKIETIETKKTKENIIEAFGACKGCEGDTHRFCTA